MPLCSRFFFFSSCQEAFMSSYETAEPAWPPRLAPNVKFLLIYVGLVLGYQYPDAQATCVVLFRSAEPQKRPTSGPPFLEISSSRENTPPEGGESQDLFFSFTFTWQKRVHTLILKQSCVLGYQACAGRSRLGWEPSALDWVGSKGLWHALHSQHSCWHEVCGRKVMQVANENLAQGTRWGLWDLLGSPFCLFESCHTYIYTFLQLLYFWYNKLDIEKITEKQST